MTIRVVQIARAASYANPIKVTKGQRVTLIGREDIWDGHRWFWAVSDDGREGWVPDNYITRTANNPVACCDYSAFELTPDSGSKKLKFPVVFESKGIYDGFCD